MINEAAGLMFPPPTAPLPAHPHLQPTPQTAPGRASLSEPDLGQGAALPANPLDKVDVCTSPTSTLGDSGWEHQRFSLRFGPQYV